MKTKEDEVHLTMIFKNCTFALALVMVLFAVSVAPVSAADGDNNVTIESIGSGTGFVTPVGIAVEADGSLVVVDTGLKAVVRVNPITGNRTVVSDVSTGSGTGFVTPVGIAVEADGSLVVVDQGLKAVVRVNPINGNRTVVSDASTGSGTGFVTPVGIAVVEADDSLVVVDRGLDAVVRVNPITGDRTVVSDDSTGSGTDFVKPVGIAVEADGSLVVVDKGLEAVVRVNPINGNRTVVSDVSTGSGTDFVRPVGIAVEADGSLVVADYGLEAVVRVNPITGNRTVVSDASTGSGTGFVKPVGIAVVEADDSLVVVDQGLKAVVRVNHITGNRTVVSDVSETKENVIKPLIITETVKHDTDDPAIWLNPKDHSKSLIIGTDKGRDGALYVFGLDGKIIEQKTVRNLKRPNNVDIEYGLILNGIPTDIVVVTERSEDKIRVFSLPDMKSIDNGGIEVFIGEEEREPMGIALYKRSSDGVIFAIVGRKSGPTDGRYLWQYRLEDDGRGYVTGTKVREFGVWSGKAEIEAIAVDDALGYVYYSDEHSGIRKYYADPDIENANKELALFGTTGFADDREGISIYTINDGTGYILVSDQQANAFRIFKREGESGDPHIHQLVKVVHAPTKESDGSDVTNAVLNDTFPVGLFVAMSDDKTFQLYSWADIAGEDLCIAPDGELVEHP